MDHKIIFLKVVVIFSFLIYLRPVYSQLNISAGNTITENFSIGTSQTATLPSGWKVDKNNSVRTLGNYSTAGTSTENRAGDNMSSTAANGIYNYGAGDASTATDRSVGGLSSSSASKSVNIYVNLYNNGSTTIPNFTISYDVEKYRRGSNSAGFSIQLYYSTDGSNWINAGSDFLTSFTADGSNDGYPNAPGETKSISSKILNVSLAPNSHLYLAWNYSVTSGTTTSNAQALGIDNVSITANLCTHPSTQASNIAFSSVTSTSMTISFTRGDGNAVLVVAREGSPVNQDPVNGNDYTANSSFGSGSQIGTGNYVVYKGTGTSFTMTNLQSDKTYYIAVYEYNTADFCYLTPAATANQATLCDIPTVNATNLSFSSITTNSMTLTWTNGNGENRIVVARKDSPVDAFPVNNTTYTANNNFGSGSQIGTGNFVVYKGSGNSFTVNNLTPGTTYFFAVIEYNCSESNEKYFNNDQYLSGNATTQPANVTNLNSSCVTNNTWTITWTLPQGNYDGILVTIRQGGTPSNPTCPGATLNAPNADFTSALVYCGNTTSSKYVYNSTGNTVTIQGLTAGQSYTIKVFTYLGNQWSSGTQITKTVGLADVTNLYTSIDSAKIKLKWLPPNNCYDEFLVVARQQGNVTATPTDDGSQYIANSQFGLGTEIVTNEFVVYKGTYTSVTVTNLTNDQQYCFKVFVRYGTQWSSGVAVCDTPKNITVLEPLDLAIIAVNTNNTLTPNEELTFICFKDFKVGTDIIITDNGYGVVYPDRWTTTEGTIRFKRIAGGTIPKGTSITIVMTGFNGNNINDFDIYVNGFEETALNRWQANKLNNANGSGFNLNEYDEIWIMQGGEWMQNNTSGGVPVIHDDEYIGRVLYGWTATGWPGDDTEYTKMSYLYPNTDCFTTTVTNISYKDKVRYTGPTTPATKIEWIRRFNNSNNWTGYDLDAEYEAATPNYRTQGVSWTILPTTTDDGIWVGTRNNKDWFDCANWDNLQVPSAEINVQIGTNALDSIVIDRTSSKAQYYNYIAKCRDLNIDTRKITFKSDSDTLIVYGNLNAISDTLDMSKGGNVKLFGNFNINNKNLFNSTNGKVFFVGSNEQFISCDDTLTFNKMIVQNSTSSNITLLTNVVVKDTLDHINGNINLNENTLTLKGVYNNLNSGFVGHENSSLIITGSGSLSDIYFYNNTNLQDFIINRHATANLKTNLTAQNITINNGVLKLSPTRFYTVTGNLINNVGANGLVLSSNALGTSSLLLNTPNIQATCQRYLSGDLWHYINMPLSNVQAYTFTNTIWGYQNPNLYYYEESVPDFWIGNTLYYPTGWTQVSGSQYLQPNKGYILYYPDDKIYDIQGGTLKTDNHTVQLSFTDNGTGTEPTTGLDWDNFEGWNLIGNPYTCALDWDYIIQNTDTTYIHPVIYYYDGATANYKYYGIGKFFNQGITINGGSQYIPANQAFFIKAKPNANGQTFTIPASARTHSTQNLYKSQNSQLLTFKFAITKDNYTDEAVLITQPDYNLNIYKKFSFDNLKPQIFILNNTKNIHYAALSTSFSSNLQIPIGVYGQNQTQYTIKSIDNNINNTLIYLLDKDYNYYAPIFRKPYNFVNTKNLDTSRFYIIFAPNTAPFALNNIPDQTIFVGRQWTLTLPEKLFIDNDIEDTLSITALLSDNTQLPEWIQFDGQTFSAVPPTVGNYNITLIATDYLGQQASTSFNLSVVELPLSHNSTIYTDLAIYPNPATTELFIFVDKNNSYTIQLLDLNGKIIHQQTSTDRYTKINIRSLNAGVYYIRITALSQIYTQKFIKF